MPSESILTNKQTKSDIGDFADALVENFIDEGLMHVITIDGQREEFTDEALCDLVEREAETLRMYVVGFSADQITRLPNLSGSWIDNTRIALKRQDKLIPQIDVEQYRNLLQKLHDSTLQILGVDRRLIELLADRIKMSPPKTHHEYQAFERELGHVLAMGIDVADQLYRQVASMSGRPFLTFRVTKQELDDMLARHIAILKKGPIQIPSSLGQSESYNAWITKQIELSDREVDPFKAIDALRQALSGSPRGAPSRKVYLRLAMRYEDVKNRHQAVDCLSQAGREDPPSARIYFWRGEQYFHLNQLADAEQDFERAAEMGLPYFGRKAAENYLDAIRRRGDMLAQQ